MKGLFLKDLYGLMGLYKKNLILIALAYGVMGIAGNMPFFFYMSVWLMGSYILSAITLDQQCGWDRYARTLPVSAGQIVGAKFLVGLAFVAMALAYALAGAGLRALLLGWDEAWTGYFEALTMITGLSLAGTGLTIPASYKWGTDKARNTMLVFYALLFAAIFLVLPEDGALAGVFPGLRESLAGLKEITLTQVRMAAAAVLAAGGLLYALGWAMARQIYARMEF